MNKDDDVEQGDDEEADADEDHHEEEDEDEEEDENDGQDDEENEDDDLNKCIIIVGTMLTIVIMQNIHIKDTDCMGMISSFTHAAGW